MNLAQAIERLSGDDRYFMRQLGEQRFDALKLVLEVMRDNFDVDAWDYEFERMAPKQTGDEK